MASLQTVAAAREDTELQPGWAILRCDRARFGGVSFRAYPQDHEPRHIHAFSADCEAIVDLRADGTVSLADRRDAIRPATAKRSDLRKILTLAAAHFEELVAIWEAMHE